MLKPIVHIIVHADGVRRAVVTLPAALDVLPRREAEVLIDRACCEAKERLVAALDKCDLPAESGEALPRSLREAIPDIGDTPLMFVRAVV